MDRETSQLDHGDVNWLGGLELKRGVEAEFVEANQRLARAWRDGDSLNLLWRPDPQAAAFRLDSLFEGHVEAVQLNAGVEMALERSYDACAQEWLRTAQGNGNGDGEGQQEEQQAGGYPLEPAVSNPERCASFRQKIPRIPIIFAGAAGWQFLFIRHKA